VLTSSLLLGIVGPLPVANAATKVVTFNANGGTGTMSNQNGSNSTPFVFSTNTYTFSGKTWDQWNTAVDGTGTNYLAGVSYTIANATTVYAQWNSITFNANGGTGTMAMQSGNAARAITTNAFTRTNFTFAGWNTAANGTGTAYANSVSYAFTSDVTLYAQWNTTVTFNSNGGSGSMANQTAKVATNLTANTFTRTNYTFAGWSTTTGAAAVAYADSASYPFSGGAATLYAQWNTTVTFNSNGGTGTLTAQISNVPTNLTSNTGITRAGYAFAGWNTSRI